MAWARRNVFKIVLMLVLLAVVVTIATSSDIRIRRRAQILTWKISGDLPYLTWSELFGALLPGRWKNTAPPSGYFVREKGRGEEPCAVLWETPQGDFWGQRTDNITLQDPRHLENYQYGPVTIRSEDVVVDIGSQIGTFTRFALGKGAGKVIAIEPDPTNNACFKRTFENEIAEGQVILIEAALWESAGIMKFVVSSRSDAGSVASEFDPRFKASRIVDVPTVTLDDIVRTQNLARVDFIKWAIGGATRPALRGAHQTLSRFRPRMAMLTNYSPDDPVVLPRLVLEALPSYAVLTQEVSLAYFY